VNPIGDALWFAGAVRVWSWSSDDAVLVQKTAELIDAQDPCRAVELLSREIGDGDLEIDPTVRPRGVVVLDELGENAFEVTFATDEQPVEALRSCGADKPLGEGVRSRRSDRRLDDPGADRSQHLVEGSDELRITVADQEVDNPTFILELCCEVPGVLGDPGPIGCAVTPAKKTLRRSRSMKNST
jgi:hypothetical protein